MSSEQQQNNNPNQLLAESQPLPGAAQKNPPPLARLQLKLQNLKKIAVFTKTSGHAAKPPPFSLVAPSSSSSLSSRSINNNNRETTTNGAQQDTATLQQQQQQQQQPRCPPPFSTEPKRRATTGTSNSEIPLPWSREDAQSSSHNRERHSNIDRHPPQQPSTTVSAPTIAEGTASNDSHQHQSSETRNNPDGSRSADKNQSTVDRNGLERDKNSNQANVARGLAAAQESYQSNMEESESSSSEEEEPSLMATFRRQPQHSATNDHTRLVDENVMATKSSSEELTTKSSPSGHTDEAERSRTQRDASLDGGRNVMSDAASLLVSASSAAGREAENKTTKPRKLHQGSKASTTTAAPPPAATTTTTEPYLDMDVLDLRRYPNHPGNENYVDVLEEYAPIWGRGDRKNKHETALTVVAAVRDLGGRFLDTQFRVRDAKATLLKVKGDLKRVYDKQCLAEYRHLTDGDGDDTNNNNNKKNNKKATNKTSKRVRDSDDGSRPSSRASTASTLRQGSAPSPNLWENDEYDNHDGTTGFDAEETHANMEESLPDNQPSHQAQATEMRNVDNISSDQLTMRPNFDSAWDAHQLQSSHQQTTTGTETMETTPLAQAMGAATVAAAESRLNRHKEAGAKAIGAGAALPERESSQNGRQQQPARVPQHLLPNVGLGGSMGLESPQALEASITEHPTPNDMNLQGVHQNPEPVSSRAHSDPGDGRLDSHANPESHPVGNTKAVRGDGSTVESRSMEGIGEPSRRVGTNSASAATEATPECARAEKGRSSPCSMPSLAEEANLFDAIERNIVAAEERDLMQDIDSKILAAEEKDLLKSVLEAINEAELQEDVTRLNRVVEVGEGPDEDFNYELTKTNEGDGELATFAQSTMDSTEIHEQVQGSCVERSRVEELFTSEMYTVTKLLPKFVPGTKTPVLDSDDLQAAVEHAFYAKDKMPVENKFYYTARLQNDEDHPDSVLLTVCGHKEIIAAIKWFIEVSVRSQILLRNQDLIRSGGQTLNVDVNPDLPLGADMMDLVEQGHGVWLDAHRGYQLAKKLGTPKRAVGCCLLQMDGVDCVYSKDVWQSLADAKANPSKSSIQLRLSTLPRVPRKPNRKRNLVSGATLSPHVDDVSQGSESRDSRSYETRESDEARSSGSGYNHFLKKYAIARQIEFKGCDIHQHSVNHSMWEQHKLKYGKTCEENCPCPSDLKWLTKNVMRDNLEKRRKKGERIASLEVQYPVGFVNRFVPKFFQKVQEQYPNENMSQILGRLTGMWILHQKQANFGMSCKETCPCAEGWELVFHMGDHVRGATKTGSSPSGPAQKKRKLSSQSRGSSTIPRKFGAAVDDTGDRGTSRSEQLQYELEFDTRQPLGFYAVTVKRGFSSVCKIFSVCPVQKRDCRLAKGTIVSAMGVGGRKVKISSHDELRDFYERSRTSKTINLWFINTDVTVDQTFGHAVNRDWSSQGVWQGKRKDGWAGGAVARGNEKPLEHPTLPPRASAAFEGEGFSFAVEPESTEQQQHLQQLVDETHTWEIIYGPESIRCQGQPSARSILRPARNIPFSKIRFNESSKVRFNESLQKERFYIQKEEPRCWLQQTYMEPEASQADAPTESMVSSSSDLVRAIESQDYLHVIKALRAGASASGDGPFGKSPKNLVSDCTKAVESQIARETGDTSELEKLRRDFELKRKVLTIQISAAYAIDKARFMKSWKRFEVFVEKLSNIIVSSRWTASGFPTTLSGKIKSSNSREELILRTLPEKEITDFAVNWAPDNVVVTVHFNEKLPQERRELVVDLEMANGRETKIGFVSIPNDKISSEALDDQWRSFDTRITTSEWLTGGDLTVHVRKTKLTPEYLKKKQKETQQELRKAIQWVEQFQAETKMDENASEINLPDSFCGEGGVSLLHAGIYLEDDWSVAKLIALGASPNKKSALGTAVRLAANIEDRTSQNKRVEKIMTLLGLRSHADPDEHESLATDQEQDPSIVDCSFDESEPRESMQEENAGGVAGSRQDSDTVSSPDVEADEASCIPLVERELSERSNNSGPIPATSSTDESNKHNQLDEFGRKLPRSASPSEVQVNLNELSSSVQADANDNVSPPLPRVCCRNWMVDNIKPLCRYFHPNQNRWCDKGSRCPFLHVINPLGEELDDENLDLLASNSSLGLQNVKFKYAVDLSTFPPSPLKWVTAGYYDTIERVYYYAERGPNAERDIYGIYWYPTKDDACRAVLRVFECAKLSQGKRRPSLELDERPRKKRRADENSTSISPSHGETNQNNRRGSDASLGTDTTRSRSTREQRHDRDFSNETIAEKDLPTFNNEYWMLSREDFTKPCTFFNKECGCRHNNRCNYAHVRDKFGSVLDDLSNDLSGVVLDPKHLHFKRSKNGWVTAAYFEKTSKVFFRAERGEEGKLSSHGIYWYPSSELATRAAARVVAFAKRKGRKSVRQEGNFKQESTDSKKMESFL